MKIRRYVAARWNATHPLARLAVLTAPTVYAALIAGLWAFTDPDTGPAVLVTVWGGAALLAGGAFVVVQWVSQDRHDDPDPPDPDPPARFRMIPTGIAGSRPLLRGGCCGVAVNGGLAAYGGATVAAVMRLAADGEQPPAARPRVKEALACHCS